VHDLSGAFLCGALGREKDFLWRQILRRLEGFGVNFVEGGDVVVPLEEGCGGADALDGSGVEMPYGVEHGMIVGVEDIFFELRVSGDVDLRDAFGGDAVDVVEGVEAVVLRGDVDVVDVEQDAAVCGLDDFIEELPLGHLGLVKLGVAADVFDGDGDLEEVLDLADTGGCGLDRFEGVGHGEEVVGVTSVDATPAEVIGEPGSFGAAGEGLEALEMFAVGWLDGAEVHGDAVLDDAVTFEDLIEDLERAAAVDHVVFGDDLEPVDDGLFGEDVVVVRDAKADPYAVVAETVEAIGWHVSPFVKEW
jgi:hypothetical protein